jgi:hypothetical protein
MEGFLHLPATELQQACSMVNTNNPNATDILHLQHEQLRCLVFMLNVSLFAILSTTGKRS